MRLLVLTGDAVRFGDPPVGGGPLHVRQVVTGLRERGHDARLIDWNDTPERSFQRSVAPLSGTVDGPLRTARRAVSVGRAADAEVVVSKTPGTYLPGLYASRRLSVPHVVHVESSFERPPAGYRERVGQLSVDLRLRAPHDAYFVDTRYLAERLGIRGIDPRRIYPVKNAVDTDLFHPGRVRTELEEGHVRRIEAVDDDAFRIGYVGRLDGRGLGDLAAAVERTERRCHVLLAGDGPERAALDSRFGSAATFLGPVPYAQIPAFYHRIDLFVLPSRTPALPATLLEAAATATPVVATRVSGVDEVVRDGETGLVVEPGDVDGLASAVDRLARDPAERERVGDSGRAAVVDSFSWDAMCDRYELYLSNVIG